MNRISIFREFQKVCPLLLQTESVMYGVKEYAIENRERRTCIILYVKRYAIRLTAYITGRVILEKTTNSKLGKYEVVYDKIYDGFNEKNLTLAKYLGDLVYDLLSRYISLKNQYKEDLIISLKERKALPITKPMNNKDVSEREVS